MCTDPHRLAESVKTPEFPFLFSSLYWKQHISSKAQLREAADLTQKKMMAHISQVPIILIQYRYSSKIQLF